MITKMFTWMRRTFGSCRDRWWHDWQEDGQGDKYGIGGKRTCLVCDKQQVCVGVCQPDIDLAPMRQWETIREGSVV